MFQTLQIRVHDTMESLYKAIGMDILPDEYLPDDYTGPSAGPIQQIVGAWSNTGITSLHWFAIIYKTCKCMDN